MKTPHQFPFDSSDHQQIQAFRWSPSSPPIACVQIAHGMADHSLRYSDFAAFLNEQGIVVYANDHRGHGKTAGSLENRGYFADRDGWNLVVEDMFRLNGIIQQENPGLPVILLGHSMGSFLSRTYMMKYSSTIRACILSGSATHASVVVKSGLLLARIQQLFLGKKHRNKLLTQMTMGAFNKGVTNPKTDFDWVTHDENIIADYIADDYCGFVCTTGFFIDLLSGLKIINNVSNIRKVRKDLPVCFVSGTEDPVGNYGKGVQQAAEKFSRAGIEDITVKLYQGGRHEMLNEINNKDVWNDLLIWIKKYI